jgi:Fic family protein
MKKAFLREQVVAQLWNSYKKTHEYKSGLTKTLYEDHYLIRTQEKEGLTAIYKTFVTNLLSYKNQKDELKKRIANDWLTEWKNMHSMLYGHIIKKCGIWRKTDVRFGSPGDEELHKIPTKIHVYNEIAMLAEHMENFLLQETNERAPYKILAQFHYRFIRIHPFQDGNGRIARAITDQLAIYFGFPPAMGGYPRHELKKREAYHKAIRACVDDPLCSDLSLWIQSYIERQLNNLA